MIKLDNRAENALSDLQDTKLSPMEEVLFKTWATANQISKPDNPEDHVDYRGIYKLTNGKILPRGELARRAKTENSHRTLTRVLQDRVADMEQTEEDKINQIHSEQRQDITHQQKLEQGAMQLKKAPYDLQMAETKNQGKQIDIQGKQLQTEQEKYKTDGQLFNLLTQREMQKNQAYAQPTTEPTGIAPTATDGASSFEGNTAPTGII
jgi:hypothetical protein